MSQHAMRSALVAAAFLSALASPARSLAAQPQLRIVAAPRAAAMVDAPRRNAAPRPARVVDTLAFAHDALRQERIELVPALEQMGMQSRDNIVAKPVLTGAAAELRMKRSSRSALQLLDRTAASLDAICTDAAGVRARACRSLAIDLTAARAHARAGRKAEARRALSDLARHADEAVQQKALVAWEGSVLAETARYATDRV